MLKKTILAILALMPLFACLADTPQAGAPDAKTPPAACANANLSYADGVALGLVEGITEFLPVSSTGHLILANDFLGLESSAPVYNSAGEAIIYDGKPYTLKDAADAYAIVIQIAAIAAVAILYWAEVLSIIKGFFGKSREGLMLARNLVAAFLPAAFIGLALHGVIERCLFGVWPVIIALVAGAAAMFLAQKKYGAKFAASPDAKPLEIHELSVKQSLVVGFLQCVALWPGTSRSMMTILGSYIVGLRPVQAAKFSFLLGLITLSAASSFKFLKSGGEMLEALSVGPVVVGLIAAFLSSAIAVKWLVGFLNRKGLAPFAWYRIFLAACLAAYMLFFK